MRYAGTGKDPPEIGLDHPLVANRQGDENAGVRRVAKRALEAVANLLPQPLDQITRCHDKIAEPGVALRFADITRSADVALEQPGFVIEAVGIQVAMRALQAHPQVPALARRHRWRGVKVVVILRAPTAIPRQGNPGGDCRRSILDIEVEAHAAFELLRQRGDNTDDFDIAPLVGFGQGIAKALLRAPARPTCAKNKRAHNNGNPGRATQPPTRHEQAQRCHQQDRQRPGVRQFRLQLKPADAGGE